MAHLVALPPGHREKLLSIVSSVRRLSPDYQRPERFHLEKDEIIDKLLRLAGDRA